MLILGEFIDNLVSEFCYHYCDMHFEVCKEDNQVNLIWLLAQLGSSPTIAHPGTRAASHEC